MKLNKLKTCPKCSQDIEGVPTLILENAFYGSFITGILLIRYSPSAHEVRAGTLWVDESGQNFSAMMKSLLFPLHEICSATVIRCERPKAIVSNVRNCRKTFDNVVAMREWKLIICSGKDALKHAFMRGAAPPSDDTMYGRFVKMPELGKAWVTVIPDTQYMYMPDNIADGRELAVIVERGVAMKECLRAIKSKYEEIA